MLLDFIKNNLKLSAEVCDALLLSWQYSKELNRGDFLIQQHQVEQYLYFIEEGTVGIFYPNEDQNQCVGFGYSPSVICSFPSFVKKLPSEYFIQTLSKTKVIGISRNDFYRHMENFPSLERLWRKMLEEALLGRIEREIDLLTIAPATRIQRLLNRSPHIFQMIPLKYIASYLRMTPETLSRNMKNIKS